MKFRGSWTASWYCYNRVSAGIWTHSWLRCPCQTVQSTFMHTTRRPSECCLTPDLRRAVHTGTDMADAAFCWVRGSWFSRPGPQIRPSYDPELRCTGEFFNVSCFNVYLCLCKCIIAEMTASGCQSQPFISLQSMSVVTIEQYQSSHISLLQTC